MSNLKPGDRVRILQDRANLADVRKGDIYTVARIEATGSAPVKLAGGHGVGGVWHVRYDHVEKVNDMFKVGDTVYCAVERGNGSLYSAPIDKGDVLKVNRLYTLSNGKPGYVVQDSRGNTWRVGIEAVAKDIPSMGTFNHGDMVCLIADDTRYGQDLKAGMRGEVRSVNPDNDGDYRVKINDYVYYVHKTNMHKVDSTQEYKPGDTIVMTGGTYSHTVPGTRGIIVSHEGGKVCVVRFPDLDREYHVNSDHFERYTFKVGDHVEYNDKAGVITEDVDSDGDYTVTYPGGGWDWAKADNLTLLATPTHDREIRKLTEERDTARAELAAAQAELAKVKAALAVLKEFME